MKSEIEHMYSSHVRKLVDLPDGIKSIRYKWVYKRKKGIDGKVETLKVMLVAKSYIQKE